MDPSFTPENAAREFNVTAEKRTPRAIDAALRRLPGYGLVARSVPEPFRLVKYRLMTRGFDRRPIISSALGHELEARLRDEVSRLRAYIGPEFDGWGIA